jgi:hypothetical protein
MDQYGNGKWSELTKLTPSNGAIGDWFGWSSDISGDNIVVGTDFGNAAYVYQNTGNGTWSQVAKLTPFDSASFIGFGWSVAIANNWIVVGATSPNIYGYNGAAFVYSNESGSWTAVTKLLASDGADQDWFGFSVAISGDASTIVVGANWDDDQGSDSGSAYMFKKDASIVGGWTEMGKVVAFDGSSGGRFGESIDVFGNVVAVGAFGTDSAYMYEIGSTESKVPTSTSEPSPGASTGAPENPSVTAEPFPEPSRSPLTMVPSDPIYSTAAPEQTSITSSSTIIYVSACAVLGVVIIVLVGLIIYFTKWKQPSSRNERVAENVSASNTTSAEPISLLPATVNASVFILDDTVEDEVPCRRIIETGPLYKDQVRSVLPKNQQTLQPPQQQRDRRETSAKGRERLKMDPPS